jgi:hypothetical protein
MPDARYLMARTPLHVGAAGITVEGQQKYLDWCSKISTSSNAIQVQDNNHYGAGTR